MLHVLKQPGLARMALKCRMRSFTVPHVNNALFQALTHFSTMTQRAASKSLPTLKHKEDSKLPQSKSVKQAIKYLDLNAVPIEPNNMQPASRLSAPASDCIPVFTDFPSLSLGEYSGDKENGVPHGTGKLVLADGGRFYSGHFIHGNITGQGEFKSNTGVIYKGEWVNGKFQGLGTLKNRKAGVTFVGKFIAGVPVGDGELSAKHCKYTGGFRNGKRHGQGKLVVSRADGTPSVVYEGAFSDGVEHGSGSLTSYDDTNTVRGCYTGTFENGVAQGQGCYTSAQFTLTGVFGQGVVERGECTVQYTDGATYAGIVSAGQRNGPGVYTSSAGVRYAGVFKNNTLSGEVKIYPNLGHDDHYDTVVCTNNQIMTYVHTHCACTDTFLPTYRGTYHGALDQKSPIKRAHGQGELRCGPHTWVGQWQHGRLYTGSGVVSMKDGTMLEGSWTKGVFSQQLQQQQLITQQADAVVTSSVATLAEVEGEATAAAKSTATASSDEHTVKGNKC